MLKMKVILLFFNIGKYFLFWSLTRNDSILFTDYSLYLYPSSD